MVNPIKKLFIVFICLAIVACARSPKVIDAESLSMSIAEDIAELEVDASLKNIDLHTAIAIAVPSFAAITWEEFLDMFSTYAQNSFNNESGTPLKKDTPFFLKTSYSNSGDSN